MKLKEKWEILYAKHWDKTFGELVCTTLGFPKLLKNLHLREIYKHKKDHKNFRCENERKKLTCCPTKPEKTAAISQVALACEQGKISGKNP